MGSNNIPTWSAVKPMIVSERGTVQRDHSLPVWVLLLKFLAPLISCLLLRGDWRTHGLTALWMQKHTSVIYPWFVLLRQILILQYTKGDATIACIRVFSQAGGQASRILTAETSLVFHVKNWHMQMHTATYSNRHNADIQVSWLH